MIYYFGNIVNMKEIGGDIMSFLFEESTREEREAIREQDGFYRGLEMGKAEGIIEVKLETAKIMKSEG